MKQSSEIKVGYKIVVTNTPYPAVIKNGTIMTVVDDCGEGYVEATVDGSLDDFAWYIEPHTYEPYVKETPMTQTTQEPKLWKDMTPEEKGALLLAHHEGKVIQSSYGGTVWATELTQDYKDHIYYRVKPAEPVIETVALYGSKSYGHWAFGGKEDEDTHKITLTIRDGVVDPIAQVEEL